TFSSSLSPPSSNLFFFLITRPPPRSTLFPYTTLFRSREMLELLQRGRLSSPDTASELVSREQDLRHRIAELTHDVDSADADALRGSDAPLASAASREALGHAQEAYGELLLEMRERSPRHSTLVSPVTATWRDVGRRLGSDAALIEYLASDSGSLAFVVTRDTFAVVDLGVERRTLARLVEFARGTLVLTPRPPLRNAETTPAESLWRGPLRQLHQYLIAPLEETG